MSKPVFYTFGGSVWAAVDELAIPELGYGPNDIETKVVNLVQGENFKPSFLEINPNATLPTLTADGKTYASTIDVTKYLIDHAPKPASKPSGTNLVVRIHEADIDPNFALLLARSDDELKAKGAGIALAFLSNRQASLEKNAPTPEAAKHTEFYKSKMADNGMLKSIYEGNAPPEAKGQFYAASNKHWDNLRKFILEELPTYLPESGLIGGETPDEDDFHTGAWLARIVATLGGTDVSALSKELNAPVPPKVESYWKAWSGRDSWKSVYAEGLH